MRGTSPRKAACAVSSTGSAMPSRATAQSTGKSACSSVAPSSRKSSSTWSATSYGRASFRSILLMTTIGLRSACKAFCNT